MTDADEPLTPASPDDLADALAFALRFQGRKPGVTGIADNCSPLDEMARRGRRRCELRVLDFPTPNYAKTAENAQARPG